MMVIPGVGLSRQAGSAQRPIPSEAFPRLGRSRMFRRRTPRRPSRSPMPGETWQNPGHLRWTGLNIGTLSSSLLFETQPKGHLGVAVPQQTQARQSRRRHLEVGRTPARQVQGVRVSKYRPADHRDPAPGERADQVAGPEDHATWQFKALMQNKPEALAVDWTHRHYVKEDEYIPFGEDSPSRTAPSTVCAVFGWDRPRRISEPPEPARFKVLKNIKF